MKKTTWPDRFVLGVGYPWAMGLWPYKTIGISGVALGCSLRVLRWRKVFWRKDVPQYRLVLERVK